MGEFINNNKEEENPVLQHAGADTEGPSSHV